MVEGLRRAAHLAEVLANAHRMGKRDDIAREIAALARLYRHLAGEEVTDPGIVDVRTLQTRWQRFRAWLASL